MTKASDNAFPSLLITEGTEPSAPAAGKQRLYIDSTTHKLKRTDSSGTDVTLEGGLVDQGAFTYLDATEASAPSTPASGKVRVYAKADGRVYSKDDAGVEYGPFDTAGGGAGPQLYIDTLGLTVLDEFNDISAWTAGGSPSVGSLITTETYDPTCLDVTFPSQSDRYYRAIDSGDWTYYLIVHGMNNATPSPLGASAGMLALAAIDNSGTGTAINVYNDGQAYLMAVASHAYNSTVSLLCGIAPPLGAEWTVVYRLSKSGTTITAGISFNGGVTYYAAGRTDATTFTRIAIIRLFSGGGTNPKLRVGRLYLVP